MHKKKNSQQTDYNNGFLVLPFVILQTWKHCCFELLSVTRNCQQPGTCPFLHLFQTGPHSVLIRKVMGEVPGKKHFWGGNSRDDQSSQGRTCECVLLLLGVRNQSALCSRLQPISAIKNTRRVIGCSPHRQPGMFPTGTGLTCREQLPWTELFFPLFLDPRGQHALTPCPDSQQIKHVLKYQG